MKNKMEIIKAEWKKSYEEILKSRPFQRILSGDLTVDHYKSVLCQIFHHARENPQIQALATIAFRGKQRDLVKPFYRHAISEVGHDQLALNDLVALGEDVSKIPFERPLPATSAIIAYGFYQAQHLNPVGYLGYLFHLEFMPTQSGGAAMEALKRAGVPENAMSFIHDHATIDIHHNKLMETYVEQLVQTEQDLQDVIYAARTTARLYKNMLEEAFEQADHPEAWGVSGLELAHAA